MKPLRLASAAADEAQAGAGYRRRSPVARGAFALEEVEAWVSVLCRYRGGAAGSSDLPWQLSALLWRAGFWMAASLAMRTVPVALKTEAVEEAPRPGPFHA
mmetsp:Transcript_72737/g.157862  ORF Transcript_72737/g.157862 Transcript_72737/m.157862 type:complete len:101 (+) Transcript_72737:1595-1897(+)